jgi:ABC-type Na+ efflux pump permease subunit
MRRRSTWVGWALLGLWMVSAAALVVLSVASGSFQRQPLANTVGLLLAFAAFMVVGALIVANRPGNAIGWVFSAIALLAVLGALAEEYAGWPAGSSAGPGTRR